MEENKEPKRSKLISLLADFKKKRDEHLKVLKVSETDIQKAAQEACVKCYSYCIRQLEGI